MRPLPLSVLMIVGMILAAGCTRGGNGATGHAVTDDLGRSVRLPQTISRVITLSPSVTEVVFAAGAGDLLVGVSTADDHPPAVDTISRFNAYPPDLEAIVSLSPDLVLASDQVNHPEQVTPLERLGIPTYFLASRALYDLPDVVRRVGMLLGTEPTARRAADSLETGMRVLRETSERLSARPSVLVLASAEPLYGFGSESYVHDLIRLAGGRSVTDSITTATPILSDEYVLRTMPDVILGTDSTAFSRSALLRDHPTWDIVPAIANDRILIVDPDLIYRHGPRLVEGAYQIARGLHPKPFAKHP